MQKQTEKLHMEAAENFAMYWQAFSSGAHDGIVAALLKRAIDTMTVCHREHCHDLAQQQAQRMATSDAMRIDSESAIPH